MRKILEVIECPNGELKFNTDVDIIKNPDEIPDISSRATFCMATKLWGGNEHSIMAMIRVLFMADMALSPNRKQITKQLCNDAEEMFRIFEMMSKQMAAKGQGQMFPPGMSPNVKGPKN